MRRLALVVACALACAAPAQAAFFPGDVVDGPSPDIERLGGLDVAEDGGSALSYLKRVGGDTRAFVSRMENGAWQEPEQLDLGLGGSSTQVDVARIDDGRILAVWIMGDDLWARVRPAGAIFWSPPERIWTGGVSNVSVDMSIHGVGYVAFRTGGDVRVMRLSRFDDTWSSVDQPIDFEPSRQAGLGEGPRMIAVQDGTGLVIWEEEGGDARRRVWARRVIRTQLSPNPREVSVDSFEGRPGLDAGAPSAGIEYDSNYGAVAFEQTFLEAGVPQKRVLARRLVGVEFDPPTAADGLGWGGESAERPHVDVNARGETLIGVTHSPSHTAVAADFNADFAPRGMFRLEETPSPSPAFTVTGVSDIGDAAVGWLEDTGSGGVPTMMGRFLPEPDPANPALVRPGPPAPLSAPGNGPPVPELGIDASADRVGDIAFAYIQGSPEARRVMVGVYDRPARATWGRTITDWQSDPRYRFAWSPVVDLWGSPNYRVELNGVPIGTTTNRTFKPDVDLPDGRHRWRVVTIDFRGQVAVGPYRPFNLEAHPPTATMTLVGAARPRGRTRIALDIADRGKGFAGGTLSFGDGTRPMRIRAPRRPRRPFRRTVAHRYRRAGTYTARLTVRDRARHRGVYRLRVRVG